MDFDSAFGVWKLPLQSAALIVGPDKRKEASMAHATRWIALVVLCGGLSGCGVFKPTTQKPQLFHPGTIQQQRFNAVAHDPYPDQDAAPAIDGGRPRDYQKQLPEPVRNRWLSDSWWGR